MTRVGILTKVQPGIHATRKGKSLTRAGKILQMVSGAWGQWEERGDKRESEWEKDRGCERKENRGPRESGS